MVFRYSKDLYPKIVLIKAAYHFTDMAYIHLDCDENEYSVHIEAKDGNAIDEKEFDNVILSQLARYEIYQQTKDIRTISLARALASSIIENQTSKEKESEHESIDAKDILKDWFDTHE